jgi:hypothetical protein
LFVWVGERREERGEEERRTESEEGLVKRRFNFL